MSTTPQDSTPAPAPATPDQTTEVKKGKTNEEWLKELEERDKENEKVATDLREAAQKDAKEKAKAAGVEYPEDKDDTSEPPQSS